MLIRSLLLILAGLVLAACASSGPGGVKPDNPYAAHAGEATKEFSFTSLYNWSRIDDDRVVIWARPDRAYLLTLRNSCLGMTFATTIAVDGFGGRVRAGSDSVVAGGMRCRIDTIQPIDLVAMSDARKARNAD